ncbi:DUF3289 family protein, partial [Emticicia sp. W12TSBA100-4]|uniref:DUF3289 family protein n=1 Tax=Emticicia sp. W12TSBA100-4 TaxID=3160965 RepID=UPI00330593BC
AKDVSVKGNEYEIRAEVKQTFGLITSKQFVNACRSGYSKSQLKNFELFNRSTTVNIISVDKTCNTGGSITVHFKAPTSPPYSITISGGTNKTVTTDGDYTFDGLNVGTYHIAGKDANDCPLEIFPKINDPFESYFNKDGKLNYTADIEIKDKVLTLETIIKQPSCSDSNGQITVISTGGASTLSYLNKSVLYINGTKELNFIDKSYNNEKTTYEILKNAGQYELKIKDAFGCSVSKTVSLVAPPALTTVFDKTDISCDGLTKGIIRFVASGGTPPYTYQLTGHARRDFVLSKEEPYFDNLDVGSYEGKVIDKNGCEAVFNTSIISNTVPLTVNTTTTDATCSTNGSITVTAQGCTPPYKYSIDGTNFQDSNVFENLIAGNYTITVKESMGNVVTVQAPVTKNTDNEVERSTYEPPILGIANARLGGEPIIVQWDANTTAYTFTPKEGISLTRIAGTGKFQLSTTNPEDKKWEGIYGVYFKKNDHNSFIGFYNETMIGICTPSGYTLNCNPMCKERWLPEEVYDSPPFEFLIAKRTDHRPRMNWRSQTDHTLVEAEDMKFGNPHFTKDELFDINYLMTSNYIDNIPENHFETLKTMADWLFTIGNLQINGDAMIEHFKNGNGTDYSNPILTEAAKNHQASREFINRFKIIFNAELGRNNGNYFYFKDNPIEFPSETSKPPRPAIRPQYSTWSDRITGLTFATNDIWSWDIKLLNFKKVGNTYEARIKVVLYDHFGLDRPDIEISFENWKLQAKPASFFNGFLSWFILQHYYGYKPFVTVIEWEERITGTF